VSAFYDDLKATAIDMIQEFGIEYTFTNSDSGEYDTQCGTREFIDGDTYKAFAVAFPIDISSRTDSLVDQADITLTAVPGNYQKNDTTVIKGDTYRIMALQPIEPGDTQCAVTVFLQR